MIASIAGAEGASCSPSPAVTARDHAAMSSRHDCRASPRVTGGLAGADADPIGSRGGFWCTRSRHVENRSPAEGAGLADGAAAALAVGGWSVGWRNSEVIGVGGASFAVVVACAGASDDSDAVRSGGGAVRSGSGAVRSG
jgi:hypothetical protein